MRPPPLQTRGVEFHLSGDNGERAPAHAKQWLLNKAVRVGHRWTVKQSLHLSGSFYPRNSSASPAPTEHNLMLQNVQQLLLHPFANTGREASSLCLLTLYCTACRAPPVGVEQVAGDSLVVWYWSPVHSSAGGVPPGPLGTPSQLLVSSLYHLTPSSEDWNTPLVPAFAQP